MAVIPTYLLETERFKKEKELLGERKRKKVKEDAGREKRSLLLRKGS